jgi:1-acyl-sn-glycerol-3-phosphate acyltransferase
MDKSRLFLRFARPYVARRLRRQFFDVRLAGLDHLRPLLEKEPVILACNHVAWWDPLLLVHLDRVLGSDGYCLMDRKSLAQLPFFRWVGALPLDRSSSHKAYRDISDAARVLDAPGRVLSIFPHGAQRPAHLPLEFKSGVAVLAARTLAPVVPLAIRYDFLESPRQVVHLRIGSPLRFSKSTDTKERFVLRLECQVKAALHDIDNELLATKGDCVSLLYGRNVDSSVERIPRTAAALRALTHGDVHE